jgi:hypothetical protein
MYVRQLDSYSVGTEDPFTGCYTARFDRGYFSSSAKAKNSRKYTSIYPYNFMALRWI